MNLSDSTHRIIADTTNAKRLLRILVVPEGEEDEDDLILHDLLSHDAKERAMLALHDCGAVRQVNGTWLVTEQGRDILDKLDTSFIKLSFR